MWGGMVVVVMGKKKGADELRLPPPVAAEGLCVQLQVITVLARLVPVLAPCFQEREVVARPHRRR